MAYAVIRASHWCQALLCTAVGPKQLQEAHVCVAKRWNATIFWTPTPSFIPACTQRQCLATAGVTAKYVPFSLNENLPRPRDQGIMWMGSKSILAHKAAQLLFHLLHRFEVSCFPSSDVGVRGYMACFPKETLTFHSGNIGLDSMLSSSLHPISKHVHRDMLLGIANDFKYALPNKPPN